MMSEVRCPMCGKLNPANLEVCQFCQARLKPLVISPSPDEQPEQPDQPSGIHPESGASHETESDWLSSLRSDEGEAIDEEDSIDWLEPDLKAETGPDSPFEQPANQVEDWLASLRSDQGEDEELEPPSEEPALSGETQSWVDEPGWFSELRDTSPAGDEPTDQGPLEFAEGDDPDWLHRIRQRQLEEEGSGQPEPESESPAAQDEAGDWRAGGPSETGWEEPPTGFSEGEAQEASAVFDVESADQEPEIDLPAWMRGAESSELDEVEPEKPLDDQATALPDWLSQFEPEPGEGFEGREAAPGSVTDQGEMPKVSPFTDEPEISDEEVPGWLAELDASEPVREAGEEPAEIDEAGPAVQPEWISPLEESASEAGAENLPDWEAEDDSDLDLDWLDVTLKESDEVADIPGEAAVEESGKKVSPFVGEFPEILADLARETGEPAQPGEEPDLARADLPGWLEAMRPVEAAATPPPPTDKAEQKVESSGPLAGLRGVLSAETEIARIKKPGTYTVKLQISDNQKAHIALLRELIEHEGEPTSAPAPARISSPMVFRVLIFVLIIAAILAPGFMGTPTAGFSAVPAETLSTSRIINALPANAPVLLAVDYDPGLTGELEAAAAPVLDHLMLKGAYLTLVSTSPTGPVQAERLIRTVNAMRGHQYQDETQYANLGFIPGGATGLLAFAQTPQRVVPFSTIGSRIWDLPGLGQVNGLQDFSLAVVITDSPDKARAWIEQVQPVLQDTPLAMVLSAQAEPLVRPYYSGLPQQVQGMVTSLAGGMAYETVISRPGRATGTWDGFSLGALTALTLMILLGLLSAASAWMAQRRQIERKGGV